MPTPPDSSPPVISAPAHDELALLDAMPDAVAVSAGDLVTYGNPAFARLLGAPASDALLGKPLLSLFHPKHHERIRQCIETTPHDEARPPIEAEVVRLDGGGVPVEVLLTHVVRRDQPSILVVLRDLRQRTDLLTGRKQPEDVPQTNEARYRTLFEYAPIGIVYADAESYYVDANASICKMLGYSRDEIVGLHASDIVAPTDVQHIRPALNEIHGQSDHRREWQFRRKDGSVFAADVIATKFPDGTLLGMIQDVTVLKEREREIARMTRLYLALSQVNEAIVWRSTRDELFQEVCRVLVEDGGFHMAWIGWHDPEAHRLEPVAECGDEGGYLRSIEVYVDDRPEGRGPSGTAFRSGQPYVSNDLLAEPDCATWWAEFERRGFRASAAFPIRARGTVRGTLCVYANERDVFHDKEVALLEEAAADLSFALDNFAGDEARRQAEQTLRNEKLFSDTMIESMPGVVYFYDSSGHFLRWNRNFEAVSGYSGDEIARMHPTDFFSDEEKPGLQQRIAEVFEKGESSIEASFVARDGTATPYFFTGRRVELEGDTCLVGVGIDISDRRRAEDHLAESEAHLVEAQRIAKIGSWELDTRTDILRWSDQVYEIFGVDKSDFASTYEAFIELVHPSDRGRLQTAQQTALAGQARLDIQHRIVLRDGSEKVVHELADLKRDETGRPIILAGTIHDITDRVRIEAEREKRHRAEAADRVKSAFLATMSHELRTPLNSIIGFTGIILQGLAGPLNPEQSKQLGMVRTSARHLLALVNDVLDISKIEAGQLEVAREPFDLRRSIAKVLALVTPLADANRLALRVELAPELSEAVGDERRFEQILLNLLSNAIKFTEHGEIALSAELVDALELPGAASGQTAVRVRVSDTGMGIKPEDLQTLFQPFRQVDSGLSRKHDGTGLGLVICRRLAALMGGEMGVESEWGKGSTFCVTLPLKAPVKS